MCSNLCDNVKEVSLLGIDGNIWEDDIKKNVK